MLRWAEGCTRTDRAHRDSVLLAAEAVDAIFAPSAEALEGQRAAAAAALGDARGIQRLPRQFFFSIDFFHNVKFGA